MLFSCGCLLAEMNMYSAERSIRNDTNGIGAMSRTLALLNTLQSSYLRCWATAGRVMN